MVKVGPKLPPPTRRELARLEKEQKLAEQLEIGFNPAVLGEPRERVIYLFRIKKAAHHPKLEDYELEEARRKREKNHRRALARKLAKSPAGADAGQGSMDCTYLASGISTNLDDTTHSTTFAEASVGRTALLDAEAVSACLESGHFDEKSTGAPLSIAYSDGCLVMDTLAKNPCRDENFSSLTRALEFDSGSKGSLDDLLTVSVSAGACLDSPMLDLSDPLCKSGPVCSAPSEGPNVANEPGNLPSKTGRTNVQTEKTASHPNNTAPSVLVFPNKSVQEPRVATAKFSRSSSSNASRDFLPTRHASSKSSIFSEPLDPRKYSLKPPSTRSSSRSYRSPLHQFTSQRSISEGNASKASIVSNQLFKFPEPPASSASNLSVASNFRILSGSAAPPVSQTLKAEPIFPTISKGAEGFHGSEYFTSSGKPRYVGPSSKALLPHFPTVYETKSGKALLALSRKIKSDDRLLDKIEPTRGINLRPLRVNYPRALVEPIQSDNNPTAVPQPRFGDGSIIRPDPRGDRTPRCNDTASGGHSKDDDNFSSNNSTTLGMEEKQRESRADQRAILRAENNVGNDDPKINLGSTSLAPAAPIIQERRATFSDNFFQQRQGLTVDDLEKGVLDPQTPTRFPRATGGTKCPDSPLDTRSGIVAPASTPVSRSPLLFAIALPSPPWSRSTILPTHVCDGNSNTEEGGFGGLVLALKWMLKKTLDYFWQRRG